MVSRFLILFLLTPLVSCASLTPGFLYKKQLEVCTGGQCFTGTGVFKNRSIYNFHVKSKGRITHLFMKTSHRESVIEAPFVKKGLRKIKTEAKLQYKPVDLESGSLWNFTALDEKRGEHSWGLFTHEQGTKDCRVACNGTTLKGNTVICQTKVGLKVRVYKDKDDEVSKGDYSITDSTVDYIVPKDNSNMVIMGSDHKYCVVYFFGYERIPLE